MKLFAAVLAVALLAGPALTSQSQAADQATPMQVEKECILIGRILGRHVMLYPGAEAGAPGFYYPPTMSLGGFEVLNPETGEWHPLTLSEKGYFCANLGMGRYELRGRDPNGHPYIIHRFSVPRGMAVNLGTFRIQAINPNDPAREGWLTYLQAAGYRVFRHGTSAAAVRAEHLTGDRAYDDCEGWFASCHDEVFQQFSSVMARR